MELRRGSILGSYELLTRIGKGGMASVWVARTLPHSTAPPDWEPRLVAIKAMLPELARDQKFRNMFLDEGALVQSIDHPNVVHVYDVGESHGILFMAMEWVEGDSLHAVIAEANKRRPIPAELAARVIADTAGGLHAAHEVRDPNGRLRGLVHCDVSPHNILVGLDGQVKLTDFGVASAVGHIDSGYTDGRGSRSVRGKFGYMSPEQTRAKGLDRRSDVFSLGIVLFELTTGFRLFRGEDAKRTVELVRRGSIPAPSQLIEDYPKKLEDIVSKALERDLDRRFQSAREFREALEQYMVEERIMVPSAGVAGLLKRVLRERIEQRRGAIRTAVLELDGEGPEALLPSRPVFNLTDEAEPSQPDSASAVSASSTHTAAQLSDKSPVPQSLSTKPAPRRSRGRPFGKLLAAAVCFLLVWGAIERESLLSWLAASEPDGPTAATQSEQALRASGEAPGTPSGSLQPSGSLRQTDTRLAVPSGSATEIDSLPPAGVAHGLPGSHGSSSRSETARPAPKLILDVPADSNQPSAVADDSRMFDHRRANQALSRTASMAGICRRPGATSGNGKVRVTFSPSGRVSSAEPLGRFAGTPVGQCVASTFQRVSVPAFDGKSMTLTQNFRIPE